MKNVYGAGVKAPTEKGIKKAEELMSKEGEAQFNHVVYETLNTSIEVVFECNQYNPKSYRVFLYYNYNGGFVVDYEDGRYAWEASMPEYLRKKVVTVFNTLKKWANN